MGERLERRHLLVDSAEPEREQHPEEDGRQADVEDPDAAGRVADPGAERLDLGSRHLRLQQLPAADAQPRQDRQREHDDPDPAEPLRQLAPQREPARKRLDVRHDRPAGRAETGHALEVRIQRTVELRIAGEDVRQRSERRCRKPRQRDDEEALTDAEPVLAARGQGNAGADRASEGAGREERPRRLVVADRDGRWDDRGRAQVRDQRSDDVQRADDVDGEEPRSPDRPARARPCSQSFLDLGYAP